MWLKKSSLFSRIFFLPRILRSLALLPVRIEFFQGCAGKWPVLFPEPVFDETKPLREFLDGQAQRVLGADVVVARNIDKSKNDVAELFGSVFLVAGFQRLPEFPESRM